jgi:antitoxin component YwqK of YwqJK toxin-antitoxin module
MYKIYAFTLFWMLFAVALSAQTAKNAKQINSQDLISTGIEYHDKKQWSKAETVYKSVPLGDSLYYTAQYELALTIYAQEQYEEALSILENIPENVRSLSTDNILGLRAALNSELNRLPQAIELYDMAVKRFPYNYNLHYNQGVVYRKMEDYPKVIASAKKAVFCYPLHQTSHYLLGMAYLQMRCFVSGILALNYAVMIDPESGIALSSLQTLDELFTNGFDLYATVPDDSIPDEFKQHNRKYKDLETVLRSNYALSKKFKPKTDVRHLVALQTQLLFENMEADIHAANIEDLLYIPSFKTVLQNRKDFNNYVYLIFRNTDIYNNKVMEKAKQMNNEFKKLYGGFLNVLDQSEKRGIEQVYNENYFYQYNDKHFLQSFGKTASKDKGNWVEDGIWTYITQYGAVDRVLSYVQGVVEGKCLFYDDFGHVVSEGWVKDNQNEGEVIIYFSDPTEEKLIRTKVFLKEGEVNGLREEYNYAGILIEKSQWQDDVYHGEVKTYYPQGQLSSVKSYKDGIMQADAVEYFENGNIHSSRQTNEQGITEITYYFGNGNISGKRQVKWDDMLLVGEYVDYYPNGVPSYRTKYNDNGNQNGITHWFYPTGNVHIHQHVVNDTISGSEKRYSPNHKLSEKLVWSNGRLEEVILYNHDGSERERIKSKNGANITYDHYLHDTLGISFRVSTLSLNTEGKKQGICYDYSPQGTVLSKANYDNDKLNGDAYIYYPNGKLQTYSHYENDVANGLYISYYPNDTIRIEGYLRNDQQTGAWYQYYPNGALQTQWIYDGNGTLLSSTTFYCNGTKETVSSCYEGMLVQYDQYDHEGKLLGSSKLPHGKGIKYNYWGNGEIYSKDSILAGQAIDTSYYYDFSGKPWYQNYFINGKQEGNITYCLYGDYMTVTSRFILGQMEGTKSIYANGELEREETSCNGEEHGTSKIYYANGRKYCDENYEEGERNGISSYYAPDGKTIIYQIYYLKDIAYACSFRDENNKMTPPHFLDAKEHTFTSYYPDGKPSAKMTFIGGLLQGEKTIYYPSGKLCVQRTFVDDDMTMYKSWYENGNPYEDCTLQNKMFHGTYTCYHPNGKIYKQMDYIFDMLHGNVNIYNTNGQLQETQEWKYDLRIK